MFFCYKFVFPASFLLRKGFYLAELCIFVKLMLLDDDLFIFQKHWSDALIYFSFSST